tara:strand:+ start:3363 stop:3953 length:591 start_codon:yes stop_codon:yes gene_type:complete
MAKLEPDVISAIQRQTPKVVKKDLDKEFRKKFDEVKKRMIKEFLNHPVSVEISGGSSAGNVSGTLGGITNLSAFIGFSSGDNPLQPILEILESINFRRESVLKKGSRVGYTYAVDFPEPQKIFLVTPLPWATGRSWAKGIETGISGLGFLLRKSSRASRSGAAIQTSKKVRGGKFQNVPYISALLSKYKKQFEKLK